MLPMRARFAERLDQSGPAVSQTVARIQRGGLLHVAADRHLELTEELFGPAAGDSRLLNAVGGDDQRRSRQHRDVPADLTPAASAVAWTRWSRRSQVPSPDHSLWRS
ncbi:hypothetical protein M2283_008351 [Streptomyces pseudovenezuelae]|uniref:HTH dtxR-type domain-containing protein n=1 Tax=Streptomyces pseudovenezuelae TaxID=67350 RepID=A0ABT6M024_9ACTN|nr:hypothetical protein [Streptomyces pseudovenezuelae]